MGSKRKAESDVEDEEPEDDADDDDDDDAEDDGDAQEDEEEDNDDDDDGDNDEDDAEDNGETSDDPLACINGLKPKVYLKDGDETDVKSMTSSSVYKVKRTWDHYYWYVLYALSCQEHKEAHRERLS